MASLLGSHSLVLLALSFTLSTLACPIHTASPVVDLGYSKYQGIYNDSYNVNIFKG